MHNKSLLKIIFVLSLVLAAFPAAASAGTTLSAGGGWKGVKTHRISDVRGVAQQNKNRSFPSYNSRLVAPPPCPGVGLLIPTYQRAGAAFHVPWNVLGGINTIETNLGCNLNFSSAGAEGWMQFMPDTWRSYGMDADGDGKADPMNPVDAIYSAARYLDASGASTSIYGAIFSYNHADWYVQEVLQAAQQLQGIGGTEAADMSALSGELMQLRTRLDTATQQAIAARGQLAKLETRLRYFQAHYRDANKKLVKSRNTLSKLEGSSSVLVKQYVDVAYYSSVSGTGGDGQELLSYVGDADTPQEGVLAYTTARVLMDNRKALLGNIQRLAVDTRRERNQLAVRAQRKQTLVLGQARDVRNKKSYIESVAVARRVLAREFDAMLARESSYSADMWGLLGSGINTTTMDGHPVANWIYAILQRARSQGVAFTITSGYRTDAEQVVIWNSGVRPAAKPRSLGGPGSRHEGTRYPVGAVDVSPGADALNAWLAKSPYKDKLIFAGAKDPVHFSRPTGGGY